MAGAGIKMLFISKRFSSLKMIFCNKNICSPLFTPEMSQTRGFFRPAYSALLKVMKARRKLAGPDRVRKRNEFYEWNYNAELFAFSKRLHENISEETLRTTFVHQSYIDAEGAERQQFGMPELDADQGVKNNTELALLGVDIMSNYIKRYLRYCFQILPEEGIRALHDYLMSDDVLSHVSFNIGTSELILCAEYPPSKSTLASTLKAFIGGLASDNTKATAEVFILDFVCTQMVGKDVLDIWDLNNPMDVLNSILERHGRPICESRLIFESGRNTIESIYHVGVYSNKEFLGRGPGETLAIAEEMAAYDALRRLFNITHHEAPLPFGSKGRGLVDLLSEKENISIHKWCDENFKVKSLA